MTELTAMTTPLDKRQRLAGDELWSVASAEYRRMAELLSKLRGEDWSRATDCTAWDVRAMAGHLVGGIEGLAHPPEMVHQFRVGAALVRRGQADGKLLVDGANMVQVRDRAGATTGDLVARYQRAIPKAVRWRRRFRWTPVSMNDAGGRFSFRELYEVILTRDTWIHRVDITRVTGQEMVLTPEHDGRIVEDCVIDWARKHGRPFSLLLTGPAGGRFEAGHSESSRQVDAVEFARALSGRGTRPETLGTRVVF